MGAQGHSGSAGALFAGADPGGTDTVPPAVLVGGAGKNGGISPRRARSILERLRRDLRNELEKEEITL